MKLRSAILVVASMMAASDAHAGSSLVTMGVGLTIVPDCRVSHCAAAPRWTVRPRIPSNFHGANSPFYVSKRLATAASPERLTTTY